MMKKREEEESKNRESFSLESWGDEISYSYNKKN